MLIGEEFDGLLGNDCFNALCADITQAQEQATAYTSETVGATGEQTEFWYYLSDKWKSFLKDYNFQMMYAAYAMYYYYYLGIASSETSPIGDYSHELQKSNLNDGDGGKNIDLETSNKKAQKMLTLAKFYANLFKRNFWNQRRKEYGCYLNKCKDTLHNHTHQHCDCNKSHCTKCNPHPETPRITRPRAYWL